MAFQGKARRAVLPVVVSCPRPLRANLTVLLVIGAQRGGSRRGEHRRGESGRIGDAIRRLPVSRALSPA